MVPLGSQANRQSNVRIRWHYYQANYEYYWGIDNVSITGRPMAGKILGDCEPDCDVDLADFSVMSLYWQNDNCDTCGGADFNDDNSVNLEDLSILTDNWLAGTD